MPKQRFQSPTLKQNRSGSFYIRPYVDVFKNGHLIREKRTIPIGPASMGKRKAVAAANEIMRTVNRSDFVIKSQITLGAFVQTYRKEHLNKLSRSAQDKFDWAYRKHIGPAFATLRLAEITTLRLQSWLNEKQTAGMKKASRLGLRNIASGLFTMAIKWELYTGVNPVANVEVYGENDSREKIKLTDDQIRRLLAELRPDVRLLCSVALFCGLRISEALALQERHLDFERNEIQVRQSYMRGSLRAAPKTPKGRRNVSMGYLSDELKQLCVGDPARFVFAIPTGARWGRASGLCRNDSDLVQHFLRPAAKRVGCYHLGFGFRALRREAITEVGAKVGFGEAMNVAGHSTADTSLLYTLQDRAKQDQAIRGFQERILGAPTSRLQ
jgi:integrase